VPHVLQGADRSGPREAQEVDGSLPGEPAVHGRRDVGPAVVSGTTVDGRGVPNGITPMVRTMWIGRVQPFAGATMPSYRRSTETVQRA